METNLAGEIKQSTDQKEKGERLNIEQVNK